MHRTFKLIVRLVHSLWSGFIPDGVINSLQLAIVIIAMLWDIVMSEERIRGTKRIRRGDRPELLFIYFAVVTWTVAQVVFVKTGQGTSGLEWEPALIFGFLLIGIPSVFYHFLLEIKSNLTPDILEQKEVNEQKIEV